MKTIRTQDEIVARIRAVEHEDFLGTEVSDLLEALDFEHAREFLKPETRPEDWAAVMANAADPLDQAREYLDFAWDKANGCRGLSASRSVSHLKAWLWLAGADGWSDRLDELYEFYGKPCLVVISEALDFPWGEHDDGEWTNSELAAGQKPTARALEQFSAAAAELKEELARVDA